MPIIVPPRNIKHFDTQVQPISRTRGPCTICGHHENLTVSHVFPQAIGNSGKFRAFGFTNTSSGQIEALIPRTFSNGVAFRTLCHDCNSSLGGTEDRVVIDFFSQAKAALKASPLIVSDPYIIRTKPNRLFRAVLGCFAAANDTGQNTRLDDEISRIFKDRIRLKESEIRIYYWPYSGPWLTVVRDVVVSYNFARDSFWVNCLKFKPVGFAVTDKKSLFDLPCLNTYLCNDQDGEMDIPFWRKHRENDIHWPANPGTNGMVLCSSESPSFVAAPSWRNVRFKPQ
ncbi:MAG: hypothetical protein JNK47_02710 [Mesorhizobium sp.]|nr:hypothetical protein [Mesorhizobium sp.]MBL8576112.1 hypothetical protein [Mesorhizobium sp.]